jgi:hypothetical protein
MLYQGSTLVPAQHWFKPPKIKTIVFQNYDQIRWIYNREKKKLQFFFVGKVTKFCWIKTLLVICDVNLIVSYFHLTPSWHLIHYIYIIFIFKLFLNWFIKIWMSSKWVLTIISNFLANKIIFTLFFIYLYSPFMMMFWLIIY